MSSVSSRSMWFDLSSSRRGRFLFVYSKGSTCIYDLTYIDDTIITRFSFSLVISLISTLDSKFALTKFGALDYFLAADFEHLPSGAIFLFLSEYI